MPYKDPAKNKASMKAYYEKNRTAILKKQKEDRTPEKKRATHLKGKYGITLEQYNEMHQAQDDCCKICNNKTDKLVVDHCHTTGEIRGLLCSTCNSAIGLLKEDPKVISNAIEYLKSASS